VSLTDLVVTPIDRPGELARIAAVLGEAGVNLQGLSAFTGKGMSVVHLLVDVPELASTVLQREGFTVRARRRVVVVNVPDRPAALADLTARLATAAVNIEQAYLATGTRGATRLVIVCDDPDRADEALASDPASLT
jgi:hypothetical protein